MPLTDTSATVARSYPRPASKPAAPLPGPAHPWKGYEKFLFRIAFIFFVLLSFPNSGQWYTEVAHFNWLRLNYRDLYDIARFDSGIAVSRTFLGSTLIGYATWLWTLTFATAAAAIWTIIVKLRKSERHEYNTLYYWLRVIVRYRAGIGIIGFGFTKLFPVQMPYPSLGLLNTDFGDLTAQKVFWLSVGIVPWYQVFAGVVECLAGAMLFFRRTTTIGAILLMGALGDIVYVNLAYDGGVHVYASYFVLLAAFLLVKDIPGLYRLLIKRKTAAPLDVYPSLKAPWQRYGRLLLKGGAIFLFVFVLFYLQYVNFRYDPYKQPAVAGVKALRGNYIVSEFRINNRVLPYNPLDPVRWQDVTFENWSTLTFSVNRPLPLELGNGGGAPQRDLDRNFEISGVAGGRRAFHYYADTIGQVLYLEDKYKTPEEGPRGKRNKKHHENAQTPKDSWIPAAAKAHIPDEVSMIDPRASSARRDKEYAEAPAEDKRAHMILHYRASDRGNHIVLTGIDEHKDSLYIVLDKNPRPYALSESSLQAGKY